MCTFVTAGGYVGGERDVGPLAIPNPAEAYPAAARRQYGVPNYYLNNLIAVRPLMTALPRP
jgi:hypothetical protein